MKVPFLDKSNFMKTSLRKLALLCAVCSFLGSIAQVEPNKPAATEPTATPKRYVRKFKTITDPYYGFPNLYALVLKPVAIFSGVSGVSVRSLGPTGAKSEFMITDKFSMGIDANYSNVTVSFTMNKKDTGGVQRTYMYKVSSPAVRSMVSFSLHSGTKQKFDVYSSFKIGYYKRTIKFETDDPGYKAPVLKWPYSLALRIESGFHYFPSRFFGFHGNFGLGGGALFNLGVSSLF